jgi:hypothetical protein
MCGSYYAAIGGYTRRKCVRKVQEKPVLKRMAVVARERGISVPMLKKLIGAGQLSRYKIGNMTMLDEREIDALGVKG